MQILPGHWFNVPVGGNQIIFMLGGGFFGWELKFHEISVGGNQPRMTLCTTGITGWETHEVRQRRV